MIKKQSTCHLSFERRTPENSLFSYKKTSHNWFAVAHPVPFPPFTTLMLKSIPFPSLLLLNSEQNWFIHDAGKSFTKAVCHHNRKSMCSTYSFVWWMNRERLIWIEWRMKWKSFPITKTKKHTKPYIIMLLLALGYRKLMVSSKMTCGYPICHRPWLVWNTWINYEHTYYNIILCQQYNLKWVLWYTSHSSYARYTDRFHNEPSKLFYVGLL